MDFIELEVRLQPVEPFSEILISELAELPFDTFQENDSGFCAYAEAGSVSEEEIKEVLGQWADKVKVEWSTRIIPKENWNEKWEKNFSPVEVGNFVRIRASFHPSDPGYKHEILITPKMSFGTGHHQTTWLMMKEMEPIDFKGKKVLDMGAGTGVLGILAALCGAESVLCADIDDWAVENAIENAGLNGVDPLLTVVKGDIDDLEKSGFFVILANINRNVLLRHLPVYFNMLLQGGHLLLSGFYKEDVSAIQSKAEECGLKFAGSGSRDNWAVLKFTKL